MFTLHQGIADKSAAIFRFQEISCFLLWHILLGKLRFISCRYLNDTWQELEQALENERPDEDDEEDDDDDDEEDEQEEESEEEVADEDEEDDDDDDEDDLVSITDRGLKRPSFVGNYGVDVEEQGVFNQVPGAFVSQHENINLHDRVNPHLMEHQIHASPCPVAQNQGSTGRETFGRKDSDNPVTSMRVLLVEDNYVLIRDMLSGISTLRLNLEWVTTYESALQELGSGLYDICLLDYRLGRRTALEILRNVDAKPCSAPIIIITALGDY